MEDEEKVRPMRRIRPYEYRNELKKQYGLTMEGYQELVRIADGKCEICGVETDLCVDHCHRSSLVRGILCHRCNTGLGMFRDEPKFLAQAIRYLRGSRRDLPTDLALLGPKHLTKPFFAFIKAHWKRPAMRKRVCVGCSREFTAYRADTKYCGVMCRQATDAGRPHKRSVEHTLSCLECGESFVAYRSDKLYCGDRCRIKACRARRERE